MSTTSQQRPRLHRRGVRRTAIVAGATAVGLLTVPALTGQEPTAAAADLTPFASCDEVGAWYSEAARTTMDRWVREGMASGGEAAGDTGGGAGAGPRAVAEAAATDSAATGEAVGAGATGTNLQEAGVDEPDLVKTDGERVLALTSDELHVLAVDGEDLRPLGSLELAEQFAQELLLLGDRALVVGHRESAIPEPVPEPMPAPLPDPLSAPGELPLPDQPAPPPEPDAPPIPAPQPPTTVLTVVDLENPEQPRVVRTEEVEAMYLSARSTGDTIRVVLTSTPSVVTEGDVEQMAGADWLPHRVVRSDDGEVVTRAPVVECAELAHPSEPAGLGTLTVLTLDAVDPTLATTDATAVAADGGMVYAATDRLYVATTRGGWGFPMPIDSGIGGIFRAVTGDRPATETQVHAFDTAGANDTEHVASGSVPGWMLGRWAMSARDGLLRVATTIDTGSDPTTGTEAVVTVLEESGDELTPVGSVGGLGKGEQVRAVRWFEDLAVVVTFRQTDPLYTVDLSDPAAPVVLGELKIPGYSAYLHPLGEGLLLGVGQDATETGQVTGAQLSSFDLRDLSAPARLDTITYRDAWSDVESESRAFSYLPAQRLALVPLGTGDATGVVAVGVGEDGDLAEAGRWSPDTPTWSMVLRAMPVTDDAVVAVTESERGRSLTLLRTPTLAELDAVTLG